MNGRLESPLGTLFSDPELCRPCKELVDVEPPNQLTQPIDEKLTKILGLESDVAVQPRLDTGRVNQGRRQGERRVGKQCVDGACNDPRTDVSRVVEELHSHGHLAASWMPST